MSGDILNSINKIKISVNDNDQVLWESQAAAKSFNDATEKLKEKCGRLEKEIAKINQDIVKIEPQIKILKSNHVMQVENIPLSQQSLINQKLYKKCLVEKLRDHKKEADATVEVYAEYIKQCKVKLEITNPTYKILQEKRIELKQSKIRCMDLQQKIINLKNIKRQEIEIKQKQFYSDIIQFAQNWLIKREYLETMNRLVEDTKKEKHYMQQLTKVTELLKQKQTWGSLRMSNFNITQTQFPMNDGATSKPGIVTEKANTEEDDTFTDIRAMIEKGDTDLSNGNKNDCQNPKFNRNKSKVRILETRILKEAQENIKPNFKSKEEINKEIAAKIEKVVKNLNKTVSRQNSKSTIILSQPGSQVDKKLTKFKENQPSQANIVQKKLDMNQSLQNVPCQEKRHIPITKNLNSINEELKKPKMRFSSTEPSNRQTAQFSNEQQPYFNKDQNLPKSNYNQIYSNENCANNKLPQDKTLLSQRLLTTNNKVSPIENSSLQFSNGQQYFFNKEQSTSKVHLIQEFPNENKLSQNNNFSSQKLASTNNKVCSTENVRTNVAKNSQFGSSFNNVMEIRVPDKQAPFVMSVPGYGSIFAPVGKTDDNNLLLPNNASLDMEMPGFPFNSNFMNFTNDEDDFCKSPEDNANLNTIRGEENNISMGFNLNCNTQSMFPFGGQSDTMFNFK